MLLPLYQKEKHRNVFRLLALSFLRALRVARQSGFKLGAAGNAFIRSPSRKYGDLVGGEVKTLEDYRSVLFVALLLSVWHAFGVLGHGRFRRATEQGGVPGCVLVLG